MIPIVRTDCPATLKDKGATGDHYNKPAVVDALWEMQHGKCCYCERYLPKKGHLKAVEHFAPKSIFKGLRNEWKNLLLACSQCNGKKSDKFPVILSDNENEDKVLYIDFEKDAEAAIIDPSNIDPALYLDFDFEGEEYLKSFGIIMARDGSVLGSETITTVGLHEQFYTNLRYSYYTKIVMVYYKNLLEALRDGNHLQIDGEKTAFEKLMASESEFAGFVRSYAKFKKLDGDPVNLKIPV